jgi:hypothetical protein
MHTTRNAGDGQLSALPAQSWLTVKDGSTPRVAPAVQFFARAMSNPAIVIGSWTVVRLPKDASAKLPSRGMAMAKGTINGVDFQAPLEPDGRGSHWFRVTKAISEAAGARADKPVTLEMEPMKEWTEPAVPADVQKALAAAPKAHNLWKEITPMARWDWIRWIRATKEPATRAKRIVVACSKLKAGERRPCCFNRSMCTEPAVSKGGVLLGLM